MKLTKLYSLNEKNAIYDPWCIYVKKKRDIWSPHPKSTDFEENFINALLTTFI